MPGPIVICLTPVKNEAWILDRFLKCTSTWADYIIVADQNSTDGSREIALRYPKVMLIDNPSQTFNEAERQNLLVMEARKIPGKKLLIALDADEFLTGNFHNSAEWHTILSSPSGTIFQFQWINIMPDMLSCWIPDTNFPWGFMDDGVTLNKGNFIHSIRVPIPSCAPNVYLRNIKVLHYQYTDWNRMLSKHRWYQCLERLHFPDRTNIEIYRAYHHMYGVPINEKTSLQNRWFDFYENQGIDMTSIHVDNEYWWDNEVIKLIAQDPTKFRNLFLLDPTFCQLLKNNSIKFEYKFRITYHALHLWLELTQRHRNKIHIKLIDFLIKKLSQFISD